MKHKKKAVEVLGVHIDGHQMDTKADSSASSEESETAQAVDSTGAGRGGRTLTRKNHRGFQGRKKGLAQASVNTTELVPTP